MPRRPKVRLSFQYQSLDDLDCRWLGAKKVKLLYKQLLKASGADSPQRDLLCRRAAFLATFLDAQEVQAMKGGDLDTGILVQAGNALIGILKQLGLDNVAKAKENNLRSHLAKHYGKKLQDPRGRTKRTVASARARMLHKESLTTKRFG
jgi:hypothetical protein